MSRFNTVSNKMRVEWYIRHHPKWWVKDWTECIKRWGYMNKCVKEMVRKVRGPLCFIRGHVGECRF